MDIATKVTLQECLDAVALGAPTALSRCIDRVIAVLQEQEAAAPESARRFELAAAWRELAAHKAGWCRDYADELRATFLAVVEQRSRPGAAVHTVPERGTAGLALVDDAQVEQAIEAARLVEHVMFGLEQPVSELDALVSTALGLDSVRSELNPLHPDVFAQSLRRLVERTPSAGGARGSWMKHLAEPLAGELEQIYGSVTQSLKAAGVQPARYGRGATARSHGAAGDAESHPEASAANESDARAAEEGAWLGGPSGFSALSGPGLKSRLLRQFLAHDSAAGEEILPPAYYAQARHELVRLREQPRAAAPIEYATPEYRAQSPVERTPPKVDVQAVLSGELWGSYADPKERALVRGRLRTEATRVGQVFGLEIVRRVVDEVAQDPRLLAPVREAIIACEPVLLRLAMVDPRFLNDRDHCGRQLIEAVAQRSFRYNDEFGSEFQSFFAEVNRCLRSLNELEIDSAQPVEAALAQLRARWALQDEAEGPQRAQVVQTMRLAAQRQEEADSIAWDLSSRRVLEGAPVLVQDFLFGPWALVLAHERVTQPGAPHDAHGYWSAIDDLLWSVDRRQTLRAPARLFELLPRLLATLRSGLATLGGAPDEHERFFQGLMKLHGPVLKLRAKSRRHAAQSQPAELESPPPAAEPVVETEPSREPGRPWMTTRELDAAGFDDTLPTDLGALAPAAGQGDERAESAAEVSVAPAQAPADQPQLLLPEEASAIIDALREGDWVDLYSRRRWRRAQLVWAAEKRTLFMFVSHGGQPHSMTRRTCERLVRSRFLRAVARQEVVARALDTLNDDRGDENDALRAPSRPLPLPLPATRAAPRSLPAG